MEDSTAKHTVSDLPPTSRNDAESLSLEARAALEAGLASAKRGEIKPWGDFTQYVSDED